MDAPGSPVLGEGPGARGSGWMGRLSDAPSYRLPAVPLATSGLAPQRPECPQPGAAADPRPPALPPSSDLALRNCLLAADLTVKIGDYGLSHGKSRVSGRGRAGGGGGGVRAGRPAPWGDPGPRACRKTTL